MPEREYAGRDLESMAFAERYHRHVLRLLRPYLGRHVVEVGAGRGTVTRLLAAAGIPRITALEPSPAMYRLLEREVRAIDGARVEAVNAVLGGAGLAEPADTLLYVNVLEHVEDDRAELELAMRALAPGGHLCVFVPALPGLFSKFDASLGHFRRYRKADLVERCERAGFTVVAARYFDWLGVLPWWLRYTLAGSTSLGSGAVRLYDAVGVPVIRTTEALVAPPFGKNLILVARSNGADAR